MNANQQQAWDMPPQQPTYEVQVQPETVVIPPPVAAPVVTQSVKPVEVAPTTGSKYGKLFGILGSGMGLLLGIALLVGSALLLFRKTKGIKTEATIVNVSCKENSAADASKGIYSCDLEMKYKDAAEKDVVVKKTVDSNTYYTAGQTVTIYYSSENPSEVELNASDNKTLGWILFAIGMVILVAAGVGMYFTLRTPVAAPPMVL